MLDLLVCITSEEKTRTLYIASMALFSLNYSYFAMMKYGWNFIFLIEMTKYSLLLFKPAAEKNVKLKAF